MAASLSRKVHNNKILGSYNKNYNPNLQSNVAGNPNENMGTFDDSFLFTS